MPDLCCTNCFVFLQRYRALFALRNKGGEEAVAVLGEAFSTSSALLKHEVAYVMGQMQHPASAGVLCQVLEVRQQFEKQFGCVRVLELLVSYNSVVGSSSVYLKQKAGENSGCPGRTTAVLTCFWFHIHTDEEPTTELYDTSSCSQSHTHIAFQTALVCIESLCRLANEGGTACS
jgi:hypothetical protein